MKMREDAHNVKTEKWGDASASQGVTEAAGSEDRVMEWVFRAPQREHGPAHTLITGLQNWETTESCYFKHWFLVLCYGSPRKVILSDPHNQRNTNMRESTNSLETQDSTWLAGGDHCDPTKCSSIKILCYLSKHII